MLYAILFAAAFGSVALKAFQQLSVVHGRMALIPPVSYGMALFDTLLIANVSLGVLAGHGELFWVVFWAGTGGWMGCFTSMTVHRRVRGHS